MATVVVGTIAPVISQIHETTQNIVEILHGPVINQELFEVQAMQRVKEHLSR